MNCQLVQGILSEQPAHDISYALIVDEDPVASDRMSKELLSLGYQTIVAVNGQQAISAFSNMMFDMIFMESRFADMPGRILIKHIKSQIGDLFLPIIIVTSHTEEKFIAECMAAGADECLLKPYSPSVLEARVMSMHQVRELKFMYDNSIHEQVVAKNILSSALEARNTHLSGMKVMSQSAAIFSGDLVVSARQPCGGVHVLLADFTGHGLSAAIGILPVAEMFSVMTEKGFDAEVILKNINKKLHNLLPTGMFMAASVVAIDSMLKTARVWNGGMPDVYIIDKETGHIRQCIKSNSIPLGICDEINKESCFEEIKINEGDEVILFSDGLPDAVNADGSMFGMQRLENILNNAESGEVVFSKLVAELDEFCIDQQPDDITLVSIPCCKSLIDSPLTGHPANLIITDKDELSWHWKIELSGSTIRYIDPVSIVISEYKRLPARSVCSDKLKDVLSELYGNAVDHGVLDLSYLLKTPNKNKNKDIYRQKRNKSFGNLRSEYVRIELQEIKHKGEKALHICVEDSGKGFDYIKEIEDIQNEKTEVNRGCGIPLLIDICESLEFYGNGNRVEAMLCGNNQVI